MLPELSFITSPDDPVDVNDKLTETPLAFEITLTVFFSCTFTSRLNGVTLFEG